MEDVGRPLYAFPPFCLDPYKHVLSRNGERIPLTQKAFATLLVLLEKHGHTVDKEELIERVWSGVAVEENNLSQCISAIRKALGEQHDAHNFILTIPGRGYRFVADVRELAAGSLPMNGEKWTVSHVAETPGWDKAEVDLANIQVNNSPSRRVAPEHSETSKEIQGRKWWKFLAAAATGLLIVIAIAGFIEFRASRHRPLAGGSTPSSIVVLPFLNLGGNSADDYLSDGFTEEVTTNLAEVKGLRVVARTSAFEFRGKGEDVRHIGEVLNVGAVLEGSVRKSGNTLHITAQLVSTQNGYHLWSRAYDGPPEQMHAIQDEIVEQTAHTLGIAANIHAANWARRQTENAEAHDLYLEGRYYFNKRDLPDMQRSVQLYEAAIKKDPNFALAYAGLADTYIVMGGNGQAPLAETVPRAKAAMGRALQLDPYLAEAHAALALLNSESSGKRRDLESELRRAIELSPGYASAHHWLGLILSGQGRFDEADAELRKAQVLDPLSPIITESVAENFYNWRRYDDAIEQVQHIRKMGSSAGDSTLGFAYLQKGMYAEAIGVFSDLLRADRTGGSLTNLAIAYAAAGDEQQALRLLSEANTLRGGYVSPYRTALVYVNLGETDAAFRWLQRAYREKDPLLGDIKVDPMLDYLRSDHRYFELVKEADLND